MEEEGVLEDESTSGDSDSGGELPEGSSPSPESRRKPPQKNQLGEMQRRLAKQERELRELREAQKRSTPDPVIARIREAIEGPRKSDPELGPMPDQYEDEPGHRRWQEALARKVTREEIADNNRNLAVKDASATRDDLNTRVTEQFVQGRPWLQSEDGGVNEEALQAFQKHIDAIGIEGRGRAGSLTLKQLEAAERDYRFEDLMSSEASRIQGETVQRFREGSRASVTRGRGATGATLEQAAKDNPKLAASMLRSIFEEQGEDAMVKRFDRLSREDRNRLLPHFRGSAR